MEEAIKKLPLVELLAIQNIFYRLRDGAIQRNRAYLWGFYNELISMIDREVINRQMDKIIM